MRFLVDENLPRALALLLTDAGHDVVFVRDSELFKAPDWQLNDFAIADNRIIITRDLDFPLRDREPAPGLILIRVPNVYGLVQIVALIRDFMSNPRFLEVEGQITVVTPGGIRPRREST